MANEHFRVSIDDFPQATFDTDEEALVYATEAMKSGRATESVSVVAMVDARPVDTKRWHKDDKGKWVVG